MSSAFDPRSLRLLAITDDLRDGRDGLVARAAAAARGGATMIQLRLKDADARTMLEVARTLVDAIRAHGVPVIINDRADVALAAGAAGVHVGTADVPAVALRPVVPPGFIIGTSVGGAEEVELARGADYVGIGPVFETGSKSDAGPSIGVEGFGALRSLVAVPAVAIGGITAGNAASVIAAGASGVAVIRAVFSAADPATAARLLRDAIEI